MSNVKVKSIGAIFNGKPIGSTFELTEQEAKHYASLGYVELVAEESKPKAKTESAPSSKKSEEKPKSQRKSSKK